MTRWMVPASGYCMVHSKATCANSNPERSGVGKVKWRPAWGSTAQNPLAAPRLVFVIPSGFASRCGGRARTNIGMQRDRFFIHAHHRLLGILGSFLRPQNLLHLGDGVFIEFGHSRTFFPAPA